MILSELPEAEVDTVAAQEARSTHAHCNELEGCVRWQGSSVCLSISAEVSRCYSFRGRVKAGPRCCQGDQTGR